MITTCTDCGALFDAGSEEQVSCDEATWRER
jgi:predicted  nucleic acid-binding Zn-ribbon protein